VCQAPVVPVDIFGKAEGKAVTTHNKRIKTGKHKGELFTRLPVSYLSWMVNVNHSEHELARSELIRRGTVIPVLDVTGHAIDRVSQLGLRVWKKHRIENEGIHSWLHRAASDALMSKQSGENNQYKHLGLVFVFDLGGCWPVLKTVMRVSKK